MTTPSMGFGLTLPMRRLSQSAEGAGRGAITNIVQCAERLGYDAITAGDHIVVPSHRVQEVGEDWHDPFVFLGYVAALTQRLRLLTDVIILPYRNPFAVAKAIASLDQLSGGRVVLGVAPGFLEAVFQALGIPFLERGPMTDEFLSIIKELWTKDEPRFRGRYYTFSDVRLSPKPLQRPHPPIWVGGSSRRAVRRAVEHGDGWVPFTVSPPELREALRYASELFREWKRQKPLEVAVHLERVELGPRCHRGREARGRPLTGTADQVAADVEGYLRAGATYALVSFGGDSLQGFTEQMEWFAAEVMPRFQGQ